MLFAKGNTIKKLDAPTVVTLGKFDGIHLGHVKLIDTARSYAEKFGLKTVMLTFYPHPAAFFGNKPFYAILSREERIREAEKYGLDIFAEFDFTNEFAAMSPDEFMKILSENFNCKVLVVGCDYHFGKDRSGSPETLRQNGKKYGFTVVTIDEVVKFGEKVSSTNIRKFIAERDFEKAEILLGKKYFISGTVCGGNKLGRTIGFPTANILPYPDKLLPPDGVYATIAHTGGQKYRSITNIGKNPTVNGTIKTVETFIFNFDREIYGELIKVDFCKFMREETKFADIALLKEQLKKDKQAAEKFFNEKEKDRGDAVPTTPASPFEKGLDP